MPWKLNISGQKSASYKHPYRKRLSILSRIILISVARAICNLVFSLEWSTYLSTQVKPSCIQSINGNTSQKIVRFHTAIVCSLSLYDIFENVNLKLGNASKGYCKLLDTWGSNQTCQLNRDGTADTFQKLVDLASQLNWFYFLQNIVVSA